MKKCICCLLTVAVLFGLLSSLTVAAAGSLSASANASTVTVGQSIKLNLKYSGGGTGIGAIDTQISYNATAFEYVSCSGAEAYGGAGILNISWFATGVTPPSEVSFSLTFKAKSPGNGNFSIATLGFTDDNDTSLGSPSKSLSVSCINPTKSANADLAYLKPSAGTLVPAFSPNVTSYTIEVPYTVTSLLLTTDSKDQNAQVAVNGSSTMKVGKNTRSVTVTAPSGKTKTYTITITRLADQSTGNESTTSTTVKPEEDPLEVSVDGVAMTVADTQPDIELPAGFAWEPLELSGVMVPSAVNKKMGMTLLYLTAVREPENRALFIYDKEGQFTPFNPITVAASLYTLLPTPEGVEPPAGTVACDIAINNAVYGGYVYEDTALADIAFVYATGPNGYTGFFVYDTTDGSMQRYREITPPTTDEPKVEEEPTNAFVKFIADYRRVILIAAAACGGIALLIGAILLVVIVARRPGNCRH